MNNTQKPIRFRTPPPLSAAQKVEMLAMARAHTKSSQTHVEHLLQQDISPYFVEATENERRIARRILKLAETPDAIVEFARVCDRVGDYFYWFVLSTLWVSYTGHSDLALWRRLFSSERPNRAACLMKPSEYFALLQAPESFAIYRAHRPNETDWLAYTIEPQIAVRFATERGVEEVSAYHVQRDNVLALFLRRNEQEVLVLDREQAVYLTTLPLENLQSFHHIPSAINLGF